MTIYYVDSNAAGLNNGTSWTDAYANVSTALAGSVAAGDTLYLASNHADTAARSTWTFPVGLVSMISVNSTTGVYEVGASESGTGEFHFSGAGDATRVFSAGITFKSTNYWLTFNISNSLYYFVDCTLGCASSVAIRTNGDSVVLHMLGGTIDFATASNRFRLYGGAQVTLDGVSLSGITTNLTSFFSETYGNGGAHLTLKNMDLTTKITSSAAIMDSNNSNYDSSILSMYRCKMNASQTIVTTPNSNPNRTYDVVSCDSGDGYHYFIKGDWLGEAEEDTTTYLNASYDGTVKFSVQITTTSEAAPHAPFRYKIGEFAVQDLSTAQTVTMECTSDATLYNNDIWMEVVHNDNTDEALGVKVTTQAADLIDATPTLLTTTGTGTWTVGDTQDYIITKDLGALSNVTNGNVEVWACVGKPSIVANFDLPTIAAT